MKSKLNLKVIFFIITISVVTALVYNYFNAEGIPLVEIAADIEEPEDSAPREVEFFQPVSIDVSEANLLLSKKVKFLDIRSPSEYKSGHISGAINLPYDHIDDAATILASYSKDTPFVIYGNQADSQLLNSSAGYIFGLHYKRLYVFPGGIVEWQQNNYPVIR